MNIIFEGQVPKDPFYPDSNEDSYTFAINDGRIALSDGASESFDSKRWAKLLTKHFARCPKLTESWLTETIDDYTTLFDTTLMSWSMQAAYERGSFATLLGIELFYEQGCVDVLGVGDSLAVLLDDGEFIGSFPYSNTDEFQMRPELFCTKAELNPFLSSPDFFSRHHRTWSLTNRTSPVLLCMTDALGEWALCRANEGHPVWDSLSKLRDFSDFEALVLNERQARTMHVDDTTLVTLSLSADRRNELSHT